MSTHRTLAAILILAACPGDPGDDDSTSAGDTTEVGSTTEAGGTTEDDGTTAAPVACVADDEAEFVAFKGPGYDPENGGLQPPLQAEYVASTTVLVLRPEKEEDFVAVAAAMFPALEANPGLVGWSLGGSLKCNTRRTLTVWRDEEAMMAFVLSPEHQAGMSRAYELSERGTVTAWTVAQAEVPVAWADAIARVDALPSTY